MFSLKSVDAQILHRSAFRIRSAQLTLRTACFSLQDESIYFSIKGVARRGPRLPQSKCCLALRRANNEQISDF